MRLLFLLVIVSINIYAEIAPQLNERFQDSNSCKSCHFHILADWVNSWHSKSHYNKNEYFKNTIDFIQKKEHKSLNSIKVQCAVCHNPRISVTETSQAYEFGAALHLDKGSEVDNAVNSDTLNEGINCLVCHNIDKIHEKSKGLGINKVSWTKVGTIAGPFKDAHSPYHKTQYREHFNTKSDTLCLVCHAHDSSKSGLIFTNMKKEYKSSRKQCVDCHMSKRKVKYASIMAIDNGKRKERLIRRHTFKGAHTESMWSDVLDLHIKEKDNLLYVSIVNDNPHNIPSGFGARALVLVIEYMDDSSIISTQTKVLTREYKDKKNNPTIAHLAVKQSKDMSIPAQSMKKFTFRIDAKAEKVKVSLYYTLVNDEVAGLLKLKESIFTKKFLIQQKKLFF